MSRSVEPGSDEWLAERRLGITSTDIPAILGLSPFASEGDVARDKAGIAGDEPDAESARRMRLGRAMEPVVAAEEVVEHGIQLRRVKRIISHPDLPLLRTSLDYERVGERTIVEIKTSSSRDWDAGLPEYVEAQVRWQMGVAGYPRAHVAALRYGQRLVCHDVDHDPDVFDGLVAIATDFWNRVLAGGPFEETRASIRRAWPVDDGLVAEADPEVVEATRDLIDTRAVLKRLGEHEDALVAAIQARMGPTARLVGPDFTITWRRARDSREADYKGLALEALGLLDPITIDELTARHTHTKPGTRRFIVRSQTDDAEEAPE